jgi:hypothetical protein
MRKMSGFSWPQRAILVAARVSLFSLYGLSSLAQQPRQAGPYLANVTS